MKAHNVPDLEMLGRFLANQYNVVARHQALKCGVTPSALRHKLRKGGPWQKILPGVYAANTGTVTPEQREMAALLHAGRTSVITGAAAVRRHRLPCAGLNEIDVLVPVGVRVQSTGFAQIQHTHRMPKDVWSTRGLRFAPAARAVADAAREMTRFEDVQALVCRAVQHGTCTLEDLVEELRTDPTIGSRYFRAALHELSADIRSVAEKDLKNIINGSNIERPLCNPRLYLFDSGKFRFLGIPDAWWQRAGVAAEVDSRQYHMEAADYAETMARHNHMESVGIHMLHVLPINIRPMRRTILAQIKTAIEAGCLRPELPIIAVPASVKNEKAYLLARAERFQARLAPTPPPAQAPSPAPSVPPRASVTRPRASSTLPRTRLRV
jgi:hypothetical protein